MEQQIRQGIWIGLWADPFGALTHFPLIVLLHFVYQILIFK